MTTGSPTDSSGLWCEGTLHVWSDLSWAITGDGAGGLLFVWTCPLCGTRLRADPFTFPPDWPGPVER